MNPPIATMVDVVFAITADTLPRDHRRSLADAIERALPWLAVLPDAGVHRLNVSGGGGEQALLSQRTRLSLRVPRERAADAAVLEGSELQLAETTLRVGGSHLRELLPWGTLYAHLVAAEADDEAAFLDEVQAGLAALGVSGRSICGRAQSLESGALHGWSLMLDGLSAEGSLRVLERGLGRHRRLGCGVFVPHRSAAAVGAPA